MWRGIVLAAGVLCVLVLAPPTARAADEASIKQAVERGVAYLRQLQQANGEWTYQESGMTSLAGLTLLECGVPLDDPAIQKAAAYVRNLSIVEDKTYSLALAIMFLDRLGEEVDVALIEAMGTRLLVGQFADGGWSYRSGTDIVLGQKNRLSELVRKRAEESGKGERRAPKTDERRTPNELGRDAHGEIDALLRRGPAPGGGVGAPAYGPGAGSRPDNSNTQFAILALWTARRYGIPVEKALSGIDARFRRSQNADGGWGYLPGLPGERGPGGLMVNPGTQSTASMTCAGLLGLAMVHAAANENALRAGPKGKEPDPTRKETIKPARDISHDTAIQNGLKALGTTVAVSPVQKREGPRGGFPPGGGPPEGFQPGGGKPGQGKAAPGGPPQQGGRGGIQQPRGGGPPDDVVGIMKKHQASGRAYYFLWSLERVGVAFGLETIGSKDWYNWGADVLLENQEANGCWMGTYGQYGADTCFALLFLRRANLAQDLSASLKGRIKDSVELRGGGVNFKGRDSIKPIASPFDGNDDSNGGSSATKPKEKPTTPGAKVDADVAKLSAELIDATPSRWSKALQKLRDGKGPDFTQALAYAIPQLDGDAKKKAREALAERLSNMKSGTLLTYLQDEDPELRRAAALACAMKDDKTHVSKLIELLNDPEKSVSRAAFAALKEVTKQDFGPTADATDAQKADAVKAWKGWWKKQAEK